MSRPPSRSSNTSALPSRSRRCLLSLVGSGGLLAASGCLSALGESGESNASVGLTPDRLAFADGFDDEAASLAATYGRHGVWGSADGASVDGPTYLGAYRDSLAVPDGSSSGSGSAGDREPWVTADAAAVVYRLEGGVRRVWLWTGARARQPDGRVGRSSLTRLSVGAAAGDGWVLADYAPRSPFREGPVPVSLDDRGPAGRMPLPGGGVAPDEGSRTGPDGRFGVAWQGIARGVRSANAVCEFRPAGEAGGNEGEDGSEPPFESVITFGVAGGRGVL